MELVIWFAIIQKEIKHCQKDIKSVELEALAHHIFEFVSFFIFRGKDVASLLEKLCTNIFPVVTFIIIFTVSICTSCVVQ